MLGGGRKRERMHTGWEGRVANKMKQYKSMYLA